MARLSAIQLTSVTNVDENLATIRRIISTLPTAVEHLVLLPECCLFFGGKDQQQLTLAKQDKQKQRLVPALASIAKDFNITLVAGTIPVLADLPLENMQNNIKHSALKFYNRSCVFLPSGELVAHYDKMHLFDVEVNDNEKNYCESTTTQAGKSPTLVSLPFAKLGLSVCYDLRFGELYRYLSTHGADIITVPSAFTQETGKAHWQTLLQARAIENQVYIVAAGQVGVHQNGQKTWGHSMIISPWGEVLSCCKTSEGFASAKFDADFIAKLRSKMPVQKHNQFTVAVKCK